MLQRSASAPRPSWRLAITLLVAAMCVALAPAVQASAQAVGDPDGFEVLLDFEAYTGGGLNGQDGWSSSGGVAVAVDPQDNNNQVLRMEGTGVQARRNVAGIAQGTTGTLFFRVYREDTVDANAGLSDVAQPSNFPDYEVQANMQESPVLNARNGGQFVPVGTVGEETWQCMWLVADNTSDTYEMYSLGGPYEELTQLPVDGSTTFNFRNGTSAALGTFFAANGNQTGGGAVHYDDVAIDTGGENLAVPGGDAGPECQVDDGGGEDVPLLNPLPDPEPSNLGLVLEEFVTLPATAPTSGTPTDTRLRRHNRINHLSELPDGSGRMAVPDLNGPIYLVRDDGSFVEYIDLVDEFPDMHNHAGLGTGTGFVAFHPDFGDNGTFYTVHTEAGAALQQGTDFPEFGNTNYHSVITEWVADDPSADVFAGTSTEMMRIGFAGRIHTIQEIGFNPTAEAGDPDEGLLYVLVGDGGNGVGNDNPQDLSTPQGTVLRVDPDGTDGRTGEYGIPADNPFVDVDDALPEIYAYGLRDPHRMSWDPEAGNRMFLGHIGEWQVESIVEVQPGDNFGWPEREGPFRAENRQLFPLPADDDQYGYTYPVAAYDHDRDPGQTGDAGVAVAGGFVYRGDIDLLHGYYVFTDLVRGYPYAARAGQMQRGGDLAPIEHLQLYVDGEQTTFAQLNADSDPTDGSDDRIDLRVGRDAEGELYLLSKGSGTIWRVVDAVMDPPHDNPNVLGDLTSNLVAYYDFDHPAEDPAVEQDRGLSGTDIDLVNGGAQMRVDDPAYPTAGNAMQTQQVAGSANDWKAGVFDADGVESLGAFNQARETSIMGWFKQTGVNPSPGYGAIGLAGILSGTSDGHLVRALLEVFNVNGELRLVALGRRLDNGTSWVYAAELPWDEIMGQDEWVHLAATFDFDGGEMALYANGEPLEGFYTSGGDPWGVAGDGPHYTSATDPTGIKIGGSYPQGGREQNPCNCRMDDLMFLDRATTADEIAAQYDLFLGDVEAPQASASVDELPDGSVEVTVTATDDVGVETVEYALDGGEWTAYAGPFTVDEPGDHVVTFRATDAAGNVSDVGEVSFTVEDDQADTTAPVLTVDGIVDGQEFAAGGDDEVTWSATDDESGVRIVRVRVDGVIVDRDLPDGGPLVPGSFQPGDHTLFVRAWDEARNFTTQRYDFTVVVADTTRPTIVVDGVRDGATYGDSRVLEVTASASDDGDLARFRVWLDGNRIHDDASSPFTLDLPLWDLELGEHTMRVVAVDEAGNRRATRLSFTVGTSIEDVWINLDRFEAAGRVTAEEADAVRAQLRAAERHLDRGRTAKAQNALQRARDAARDIDDLDVRRLLVRDLTELVRDLNGDGLAADSGRDAASNARQVERSGEPPVMVDTPEVLLDE